MRFRQILRNLISRLLSRRISLRVLVAIGVSLPILLTLTLLSLFHYWQEYHLLEEQERFSATQLGSILTHSLSHNLQRKDGSALIATFFEVGRSENVIGMQIIGEQGDILFASDMKLRNSSVSISDVGCWACHQSEPQNRPRTVEFDDDIQSMRISTPIVNGPECTKCHPATNKLLGMLILDISLEELQALTISNLRRDIAISVIATLLITISTYYVISKIVVQRIEAFRKPISAYAARDFTARISETLPLNDEINSLAETFNHMADEITVHSRRLEDRGKLRQRAIVEERERIARELHDGLAQVLGYVATKAVAVRLMLKKGNLEDADKNLFQLEDAAHGLLADMREDILGLKIASQVDADLLAVLREYVLRYNQLSDRPIQFNSPPDGDIILDPEMVLQLLRIVQEALANVRKHAFATQVSLNLIRDCNILLLEVKDNGRGFDLASTLGGKIGKFGLGTMQERAEEIGALFSIYSEPNIGTKVLVQLTLDKRSDV